jgi:hypothetical protein
MLTKMVSTQKSFLKVIGKENKREQVPHIAALQ